MPDRPTKLVHLKSADSFMHLPPRSDRVAVYQPQSGSVAAKGAVNGGSERFVSSQQAGTHWLAATEAAVSRKMVWIDGERFRGFGCSECGWRFKPSGTPTGTSFAEMLRNFELQRDKEFTSHVCATTPKKSGSTSPSK
jgi:hypothetical protein